MSLKISSPLEQNNYNWNHTIEELLAKPRADLLIWIEDIYMHKQVREMRRAIMEAESLLKEIDSQQPYFQALEQAKETIRNRLLYYQSLPGNEGEWECSVVVGIKDHLEKLIGHEQNVLK